MLNLGSGLLQHLLHFLGEWVPRAQVLLGIVKRFLVCVDGTLILVQVLVLHRYVMQGNHHYSLTGFVLSGVLSIRQHQHLILNQNQSLHRVVECKLMLIQLRENRANVQVNL